MIQTTFHDADENFPPAPKLTTLLTEPTIFDADDEPTESWDEIRREMMLAERYPEGW